jgi:hypothetical protein
MQWQVRALCFKPDMYKSQHNVYPASTADGADGMVMDSYLQVMPGKKRKK